MARGRKRRHTAWVRRRACEQKQEYVRDEARRQARLFSTADAPCVAYRCPFADGHDDPTKRWHFGHSPNMATLEAMAVEIRRRQGYDID